MSINGHCPHCNGSLDGELISEYFAKHCVEGERFETYCEQHEGWEEHGLNNRFSREIDVYDCELDRTIGHQCPDCGGEWARDFSKGRV